MAHATTQVRTCYLIRHAIAEERGSDWPDDTQRPLSADGVARMKLAARGLAALDVTIEALVSSPLARARQTADLVARQLVRGRAVPPVSTILLEELAPDVAPDYTMRALATVTGASSIALVGHEPDLGLLAAWLLGTEHPIAFRKGAVCCIEVRGWPARARSGRLVWFAPPKMLRRLGRAADLRPPSQP